MSHKKVVPFLLPLVLFACGPRQTPVVVPSVGLPDVPTPVPSAVFASPEPSPVVCEEDVQEYLRYSGNLWISFREIYDEAVLALQILDANKFSELWREATDLFGDFADHHPPESSLLIDYYILESETFLDFTDALDTGVGGDFVKAAEMLAEVDASYQRIHSMYLTLADQCNIH